MRRRYYVRTFKGFFVLLGIAAAWIGVVSAMETGRPGTVVSVLAGAFSLTFMWLLIVRLRSLLAYPERRYLEFGLLALNIVILIGTFAWVHSEIGLMDVSGPIPGPTHDFGAALYFSVVTSTTLGYGDFIPLGPGRPVAAIQAMTGYFILGILVSTGFQIIAPHTNPAQAARDEEEGKQQEESRV